MKNYNKFIMAVAILYAVNMFAGCGSKNAVSDYSKNTSSYIGTVDTDDSKIESKKANGSADTETDSENSSSAITSSKNAKSKENESNNSSITSSKKDNNFSKVSSTKTVLSKKDNPSKNEKKNNSSSSVNTNQNNISSKESTTSNNTSSVNNSTSNATPNNQQTIIYYNDDNGQTTNNTNSEQTVSSNTPVVTESETSSVVEEPAPVIEEPVVSSEIEVQPEPQDDTLSEINQTPSGEEPEIGFIITPREYWDNYEKYSKYGDSFVIIGIKHTYKDGNWFTEFTGHPNEWGNEEQKNQLWYIVEEAFPAPDRIGENGEKVK